MALSSQHPILTCPLVLIVEVIYTHLGEQGYLDLLRFSLAGEVWSWVVWPQVQNLVMHLIHSIYTHFV